MTILHVFTAMRTSNFRYLINAVKLTSIEFTECRGEVINIPGFIFVKLGHDLLLPYPFQFFVYLSPFIPRCIVLVYGKKNVK